MTLGCLVINIQHTPGLLQVTGHERQISPSRRVDHRSLPAGYREQQSKLHWKECFTQGIHSMSTWFSFLAAVGDGFLFWSDGSGLELCVDRCIIYRAGLILLPFGILDPLFDTARFVALPVSADGESKWNPFTIQIRLVSARWMYPFLSV